MGHSKFQSDGIVCKAQCETLGQCIEMMEREVKYWDLGPPSKASSMRQTRLSVPRDRRTSSDNGKLPQDKGGNYPTKLTFEDRLSGLERDIQEIKNAILSQKGQALEQTKGHEQPHVHSEQEQEVGKSKVEMYRYRLGLEPLRKTVHLRQRLTKETKPKQLRPSNLFGLIFVSSTPHLAQGRCR